MKLGKVLYPTHPITDGCTIILGPRGIEVKPPKKG